MVADDFLLLPNHRVGSTATKHITTEARKKSWNKTRSELVSCSGAVIISVKDISVAIKWKRPIPHEVIAESPIIIPIMRIITTSDEAIPLCSSPTESITAVARGAMTKPNPNPPIARWKVS